MDIQRTHDRFYLNENYKDNPKEYFKLVRREMINDLGYDSDAAFDLLDVGCETGSFLAYIKKCFPKADLWGMDVMPELLEKLQDGHPILADISDESTLPDKKFDVITMLGVLSIFDDFRPVLTNLTKMLKVNGAIYIFSIFNPEDLDVLIKSRKSCENENVWETGWNTFSIRSVAEYCRELGYQQEFVPFSLSLDIPKHKDDPLRSWTVDLNDGKKMIVNGLQLVHNFYLVKLRGENVDNMAGTEKTGLKSGGGGIFRLILWRYTMKNTQKGMDCSIRTDM